MSGGARESKRDNQLRLEAEADLKANPPKIVWARVRGGIWVQRLVKDPPVRKPRPPCGCGDHLTGSNRNRNGDHHDPACGRWRA